MLIRITEYFSHDSWSFGTCCLKKIKKTKKKTKNKTKHFQVCCQGKAGQGHRIESIAWYAQTIVYYTIFPNKNKWKDYWKKIYFRVVIVMV